MTKGCGKGVVVDVHGEKKNEIGQRSRPNKYRGPMSNRAHFKYFNYFTYKPRSSSLANAFDLKPLVSVNLSALFFFSPSLADHECSSFVFHDRRRSCATNVSDGSD